MIKNSHLAYGRVSKLIHWTMAALLIGMFIIAYTMINLDRSEFMLFLYRLHKSTGLLLFALVGMRLLWIAVNPRPHLAIPRWQRISANINIIVLYLMMIAMPVSGFLTSTLSGHEVSFYGLFTISAWGHDKALTAIFSEAHELAAYLLIAAFLMHVMAAIYHHFILRDGVLQRMT